MQVYASTTFLGDGTTDLAEPLGLLAGLDLDGVELGSTHRWQADLATEVERLWSKPRLTHNYFPPAENDMVLNIASSDPDIRGRSIAHMKHCLAFAADIGASLYTIHPGFLAEPKAIGNDPSARRFDFQFSRENTPHDRAFALMIDALKDLVEASAMAGVGLAIETEGSLTSAGVTLMEEPAEYDHLFDAIPEGLSINLNLAHTSLAAKGRGFDMMAFIDRLRPHIAAVEISHNDGHGDQHRPLDADAPALKWVPHLPDVPLILEFRCAEVEDIQRSATILRATGAES
ncbi:MAG: TIM barrel protein [Rhodospirillales bacterium]